MVSIKFFFILGKIISQITSKFEWMLNNIRIEKIISAPIWATKIWGRCFNSSKS